MEELIHGWHDLVLTWFGWVRDWGYGGVFVLMAMESSILPVPSEVVMPPAAFWAAQPDARMSFWGVVIAGTLGSYFGSSISYWAARWIGFPLLNRYGKFFLLPPRKIALAEAWVRKFGVRGIFVARLLPVVRHLISIPAGMLRMPYLSFTIATLTGAFIWCWILSWWGRKVLGESPQLLDSPAEMVHVIKSNLLWFVLGVVCLLVLYGFVVAFKRKSPPTAVSDQG